MIFGFDGGVDGKCKAHLDYRPFLQCLFFGFGLFGHALLCPIKLFSCILTRFAPPLFFGFILSVFPRKMCHSSEE